MMVFHKCLFKKLQPTAISVEYSLPLLSTLNTLAFPLPLKGQETKAPSLGPGQPRHSLQ